MDGSAKPWFAGSNPAGAFNLSDKRTKRYSLFRPKTCMPNTGFFYKKNTIAYINKINTIQMHAESLVIQKTKAISKNSNVYYLW